MIGFQIFVLSLPYNKLSTTRYFVDCSIIPASPSYDELNEKRTEPRSKDTVQLICVTVTNLSRLLERSNFIVLQKFIPQDSIRRIS